MSRLRKVKRNLKAAIEPLMNKIQPVVSRWVKWFDTDTIKAEVWLQVVPGQEVSALVGDVRPAMFIKITFPSGSFVGNVEISAELIELASDATELLQACLKSMADKLDTHILGGSLPGRVTVTDAIAVCDRLLSKEWMPIVKEHSGHASNGPHTIG